MGITWLYFISISHISVTGKKLELNWLVLEKDTLKKNYIFIYIYIYIIKLYIYIYILYETLISFASYQMIHDYTSGYIKSDTKFPFISLFTYQFQIGKI